MLSKFVGKIEKKYYWVIASNIAMFFALMTFIVSGMLFGKYIVMRSDLITGSISIIKDFARNILNGENIWFSFGVGLGLDNAIALTTNCLSPFNLLYIMLFNVDENLVTALIIILKVGAMAASFQIFSRKVICRDDFCSVIFAVCYSMCSFSISYGTIQIMWMDALIILPLLCIAIKMLIDNDKRVLAIILYTYLFISHFYMAYMVGIFTLLYVLLYLYTARQIKKYSLKTVIEKFVNWGLSVVVAVMLSSVFWVPTLFFIIANRADDSSTVTPIISSLMSMFNSLFWGIGYGISGIHAYIYCGIPVLLLIPFFFVIKKIDVKEKIVWGALLAFFAVSLIFTPFNTFLHVFDQPDSFWYRYSFIISFLLCTIATIASGYFDEITKKAVSIYLCALAIIYMVVQEIWPISLVEKTNFINMNGNNFFLINIIFVLGWILIAYVYSKYKTKQIIVILVAVLFLGIELVSNGFMVISAKEDRERYYNWKSQMEMASGYIRENDKGLYRTLTTNSNVSCADSWFGLNGISDFGDNEKFRVRNFMSKIGFGTSTRYTSESGYTPVSNMLLGVKYNIICKDEEYLNYDFDLSKVNEQGYITYDKVLNIGYMSDMSISLFEFDEKNAFENMNSLVYSLTGIEEEVFESASDDRVSYSCQGGNYSFGEDGSLTLQMTGDNCYFYVIAKENDDKSKIPYVQFVDDDPGIYLYDYYYMGNENSGSKGLDSSRESLVAKMYYLKEKGEYSMPIYGEASASPEVAYYSGVYVYYLNDDVLAKVFDELSKEQFNVTKWGNGYIEGTVNIMSDKRIMFTTIPYDAGWTVKVDGVETEIIKCADGAFVGFFIPGSGEHNIEMKYEVPGLKIGMYGSLLGCVVFIIVIFEKKLKAKK